MGYISNHLMSGEMVIYEAKLHSIVYLPPIIVGVIGLGLCAIAPADITFIIAVIIILICVIWSVDINDGRQFILTSKRVIIKRGIIERKVSELMLRKCEGIQVEQSILGRIFNYGTLCVTTGEVTNRYKMIKDPITFSTHINEQIDILK